ncbi:FMN-binding negative transcriptional regulator [Rhizobiales bacterium]|uniref:FMN-binding negative transcriptional regulator n=1 Tax=Hongsoonwoonella zoysiae TaxID=2821844 RepID=UPI0015609881|nr:FMN-binding negative transcriptional regulator [Hongsoonwoonella zoysiae]NRG17826.1 FMN-binding negative transcriptional regulator [Hongsoonwoonella zoysiae]
MYTRETSRETRPEVLKGAIRDIHFAMLVTPADGEIFCSHLPMILVEDDEGVRLEGHLARGNPHWRALEGPMPSLAVFHGPQAYISPSWYATKRESGKVVPTWAYVAVHAHGSLSAIDEPPQLLDHLAQLTDRNEAGRSDPWSLEDAPDGFIPALSRGIVGVRLSVERLEGSWKLNQHRSDADRIGMIEGLRGEEDHMSRRLADLAAGSLEG